MSSMRNRLTLIGHLGADPELKSFDGGKKMTRVSIATTEWHKNAAGDWTSETTWHQVTAWGQLAERICEKLRKGSETALECQVLNNNYTDKDGVKKYNTELRLSNVLFLGKQGERE